ncbi:RNA exonuclease 4-like isoform X2 [Nicotiana tabacum]|uniref:RNA exonuclease 4-like isoform X2 n=1 Tax=Nicotiana tabacum TaxID=4097 RepID=A0AC58T9J1_TOBAC
MEQPYEVAVQTLNTTRHKCSACYKQYNKKEHLIEHMKTSNHSVHDPKCGVCNKHCKSFESLREHIAGPLSKVSCSSIYAERGCTLCLKICDSVDSLNEHKEMCHLTTPRPIDTVEMLNSEYEIDISSGNSSIRSQEAVAIDCEMVGCGSDGSLDYCARVCLVDEDDRLIFHTYVLPQLPVTNYRYEITGITEENLRDAMPLNEVRQRILQILYNGESISRARLNGGRANVLVGHNLAHHLDCLAMDYPDRLLRYDIQVGFHDPYQDSVSVMRLYKRIRSQDHPTEETTRVPNSSPSFNSISDPWKSMTREKMTPNYRCWCLDSREAVQRR